MSTSHAHTDGSYMGKSWCRASALGKCQNKSHPCVLYYIKRKGLSFLLFCDLLSTRPSTHCSSLYTLRSYIYKREPQCTLFIDIPSIFSAQGGHTHTHRDESVWWYSPALSSTLLFSSFSFFPLRYILHTCTYISGVYGGYFESKLLGQFLKFPPFFEIVDFCLWMNWSEWRTFIIRITTIRTSIRTWCGRVRCTTTTNSTTTTTFSPLPWRPWRRWRPLSACPFHPTNTFPSLRLGSSSSNSSNRWCWASSSSSNSRSSVTCAPAVGSSSRIATSSRPWTRTGTRIASSAAAAAADWARSAPISSQKPIWSSAKEITSGIIIN